MVSMLFLVGFVGLHWKLIATVVGLVLVFRYGRDLYDRYAANQLAAACRRADIAARADNQHAEVLAGDGHGTYGTAWTAQQKFNGLTTG